jgi:hypothetical protein
MTELDERQSFERPAPFRQLLTLVAESLQSYYDLAPASGIWDGSATDALAETDSTLKTGPSLGFVALNLVLSPKCHASAENAQPFTNLSIGHLI